MRWHYWVLVGLGIWLLISPWVLGFSALNLVLWNNVIIGILVGAAAFLGMAPPREP